MMKLISKLYLLFFCAFLLLPLKLQARDPATITDWYIKDFQSEIIVNRDSSLDITEKITADCGDLQGKHGIYRVIPTQVYAEKNKPIRTPIKLISITDFNDKPLKYSQSIDRLNHTISWKIGDPDVTVKGENDYKIHYTAENAIRFANDNFDELYWNLNGNFWEIETDNYMAEVKFPADISQSNTKTNIYSGSFGSSGINLADSSWQGNSLIVLSKRTLRVGEGVTASVTFPKNIITPYTPSFWEKYGKYFGFLIPILTLLVCGWLWAKHGRDPKISGPVVPEFGPPNKLLPMEIGSVMANGKLNSQYISAGIIDLAVKGYLKIEQIDKKNYRLNRLNQSTAKLTSGEEKLLEKLFAGKKQIQLSDLKNKFYQDISAVQEAVNSPLEKSNLVKSSGICSQVLAIAVGMAFGFGIFFFWTYEPLLSLSFFIADIILIVFVFLIPKRTIEAAKMLKQIDGFKLYMNTAEKYRQQFYEKENIFEKYLPYAMVFGITGLWIAKMKEIYGQEYFNTYHPVWFYGASLASFDADSLNSAVSSLSSNMSSTLASSPSSSGSGGGGFSGGGGGGGGGGGW